MRYLTVILCFLCIAALATAQTARSRQGETDLKLEIAGRGAVVIRLYTKTAPKATSHIISLVKSGFYDGLRFHRVEKSPKPYLVQVGDPASRTNLDAAGNGGSGASIPYEDSGFSHVEGAVGLAMANGVGDSQFYILLAPHKFLDGRYTVFGVVVSGMDVVRSIERGDRITSATILGG